MMEDVSTDGEDLFSPTTQAMQEFILDLPKVMVVVTPKFSETAKNPPIMLDGKTILKPLQKQAPFQFSQFICYSEEDYKVEDL
jgi:hypothetical protein